MKPIASQPDEPTSDSVNVKINNLEAPNKYDEQTEKIEMIGELDESGTIAELQNNESKESEGNVYGESDKQAKRFKPTRSLFAALSVLMLLCFMASLDATTVVTALEYLTASIHGSSIDGIWVGSSFLLASTVSQPILAALSEIFGRKPFIHFAVSFFLAGACMAGWSKTPALMIAGRTVQGLGGGGLIALSEVVITDMIPLRVRPTYFGFLSMVWAVGTVIGPVIGGGFAVGATWRWIFWINIPMCILAYVTIQIFLRLTLQKQTFREKLERIDWIGLAIFTASITSLLLGVSFGGSLFPWNSYHIIVPLVLGGLGTVAFCIYEWFVPKEPAIPIRLLANRNTITNYLNTINHGIILWGIVYYIPIYFMVVKKYNAVITGVAAFPLSFTTAPFAALSGITINIIGRYKYILWVGWSITLLGCGILTLLGTHTNVGQNIGLLIPIGVGSGILFPAMGVAIQASIDQAYAGIGTAIFSFLRTLGESFGVAICGSIFSNQVKHYALANPLLAANASAYSQDVFTLVTAIEDLADDNPLRIAVIEIYTKSLKTVWQVLMGFCALGLFLSFFTRDYSIDVDLKSKQRLIEKEDDKSEN
ncbi:Vba5p [Dipodascopsis uninucleata]